MKQQAKIVLGLAFGDEGKGLSTDYLCQQYPNSLVVRFSGGQQCGHQVRIGQERHIHSNFGSGTLRGLPSFFTEHCCFYPVTLLNEYKILTNKGVSPVLYLHPLCKLTTPFDVLANRFSERQKTHGSCGLGIGKTMQREQMGYHLFAIDTLYPELLSQKLNLLRHYYFQHYSFSSDELTWLSQELALFQQAIIDRPYKIADYDLWQQYSHFIFEGSQGILLDQKHGLFPHVTYANTTSKNAIELCQRFNIAYEIFYVTRCYGTRHGKGWLAKETDQLNIMANPHETNQFNDYQGEFRLAEIDYSSLNYALAVDAIYAQHCPKHLVVTCLDQRPDFTFDYERLNTTFNHIYESYSDNSDNLQVIKSVVYSLNS